MADKLITAGFGFSRNSQWGFRLFDFWLAKYGVAIEVDGQDHDKHKDAEMDAYHRRRSQIIVLRVPNGDETAAAYAISEIIKYGTWQERRAQYSQY